MSIVLTDLLKRYGDLIVVNHVNMEVADGELFVLLGGSGSGKSTILRMIAGLTEVDGGKIELFGQDVSHLPPQKRDTGFVFQNYSIFKHMTIVDNIEFGLKLRKVAPAERRARAEELLELVGLMGLGQRYPNQLSGGQQQRVALARALAYKPNVLLLDEPFGALDVKIRAQLRVSLKEIQQQLKVTTILVTHDQEEAFELADRIGVIERGSLLEVGRPEDLYRRPQSQFVATFVGNSNLLVGETQGGRIKLGKAMLAMPEPAPSHLDGAPVRVMFRPEDVAVQEEPFPEGGDVHPLGQGRVEESIFAGALVKLRLKVEDLRGVRVLSPPPAYGQSLPPLEAVVAGSTRVPEHDKLMWVGLRHFHVLERTGLKGLLLWGDRDAIRFGSQFLTAVGAPGTVLVVGQAPSEAELSALGKLKVTTRKGSLEHELIREVQEGMHEMVILGPEQDHLAAQVLFGARVPVLIVRGERAALTRKILICTAAGEPGKGDVWMGGRIAVRSGSSATVLHMLRAGQDDASRARSERHVERAKASLESMGVPVRTRLKEGGELVSLVLSEARELDADLIVIGASDPGARQALINRGLNLPLLEKADRPVLVVPNL